jgi:hypothetical protein
MRKNMIEILLTNDDQKTKEKGLIWSFNDLKSTKQIYVSGSLKQQTIDGYFRDFLKTENNPSEVVYPNKVQFKNGGWYMTINSFSRVPATGIPVSYTSTPNGTFADVKKTFRYNNEQYYLEA